MKEKNISQPTGLESGISGPQKLRALMIDDSEDDALLIIRHLKKGGFEPLYERIETAAAMTQILEEKQWDIIICDYKMPKFNAPAAITLLKQTKLNLPIIVISGAIGEETAAECMRMGAHDYLMKDNLSRLCPAVTRELEEAEIRDRQKLAELQKNAALESLRKSKELYSRLIDTMPDVVIRTSLEGTVLFVNDHALRISGYQRDEIEGRNMILFVVPEDHERMMKNATLMLDRKLGPKEYKLIVKDGRVIPFEVNGDVIRDKQGEPTGFVFVCRDVSERKLAEEMLQKSEERYRTIVENIEDGYAELNLKGDFIFVNEALCRIDGYPKDELMKKSYRDIMDEENARKVFESYNRVFLTGDPEKNLEYEIFSKDGQKKYLDTSISAVKDESGQVVAFRGLVRDRTERIKAEEELRRSEEKYRNILETIREGYFEVDLAGNFTFFNDSVCRMSGFSRDELMGMNYSRLSANDETTRKVYQTFNRVYKTERPSEGYDWPIKRKDGSRGYVEASIMLRKDSSGGIIGFKGVIRNITERKQAEELLLASEKKYREIFNASSEAIFIHDAESAKIIDVNDSMLRIYGFNSKDEVLGCRVVDLSGDPQTGTEEEVLRLIKKTINEGPQIFEWLTRGKDGTTFWMEMQLKKTDIGGQGRILAVGRDITERKQAEEAIRENELRYRSLFDYSMDAILLTRPDDGTILDANKAACRMFGRTKQEIIDAGRTELVDTSDPRLEQLLQERARTGRMSGRLFHFRKDGTRFTAELTSSVFPDRAGTLQSCMILRDVTEREQMEVALRESEARYRTFIGATADIVYLKDSQFRYILVNKAMEEMLDKDQKDIIGKDDFQLMPLHAANKFRANDTQVVRTKSIMIVEERLGKRIYETTKFPVLLENGDVIIGGISRDITERKWAGEKIARSEKKFSAIFHFSPDPMAINDTKTLKFIDVNEAFTRWTGYSHGEVISGSLGDFDLFVNPEESEMIINALTDSREIKNAEMMIRRKDGNIRNVLFSSRIIEIDQENYILTLVHDITERKQAENKLKETEERYNALFEQSIDLVFVVGFDGRFLDANSAAFDLVGYTRDEISSLSIVNLLDDDQIPVALELIREISEYGVQQGLREFRLRHKNGTPIYVETQGASIMSNGKPVAIQGIARDITARKKAEEELLSLTRRLNDIIEFIPDATLVIDREGRVIAWNRAIEEMTGFTKDAVLGKGHYEYAIPFYGRRKPMLIDLLDKRDKKLEVSYKYVERGSKIYAETYIPELRNGQGAHLWGVAAPLFDKDGNRFGSIEVIRDITEIKAKEKSLEESLRSKEIAEEATKAKSAFLANMSHEIRTPMNGIIGLVNLALQTDLSDKQRDYLNKIESSAQGLLVIINDILDYSKIEADKMKLETLDFNLEEIMTHISDIMYPHAAQKSLDLFFHIDRNVPLALKGDPLRLQQVLINLIGNAVKFTEKGEVVVRVDLSDKFRSGRKDYIRLKFSVKDTGIGLTKEQMGDLFELFTQADSSVTRRYGGTGLGLAISRQIVQLMGGKIEAASEAGKGSVFTFLIPLGVGKKKKANRMPLPVTTLKNKRALVVDESPTAREVLADYLESFGFKVTTAASGSKALKILKEKNNFHLLLVASETSAQDGIKIVRMIRKNAALDAIPAVMIVSTSLQDDIKSVAEKLGVKYFLKRPFHRSNLLDAMMNIFGQTIKKVFPAVRNPVKAPAREPLAGKRILLVEDNFINQQVAREILQQAGLKVVVAENGKDALGKIRQEQFDLVLMDVQMPEMDGYQATKIIRRNKKFKSLPIIAMTAQAMSGDKEKCLNAGMNDYIAKPISVQNTLNVLSRWLYSK